MLHARRVTLPDIVQRFLGHCGDGTNEAPAFGQVLTMQSRGRSDTNINGLNLLCSSLLRVTRSRGKSQVQVSDREGSLIILRSGHNGEGSVARRHPYRTENRRVKEGRGKVVVCKPSGKMRSG